MKKRRGRMSIRLGAFASLRGLSSIWALNCPKIRSGRRRGACLMNQQNRCLKRSNKLMQTFQLNFFSKPWSRSETWRRRTLSHRVS